MSENVQNNIFYYNIHVIASIIIFIKIYLEITYSNNEKPEFNHALGPYDKNNLNIEIDEKRLFDVNNFTYILNSNVCENVTPLLVVIVPSRPQNEKQRSAIRHTWGKTDDTLKLVFLIGLFTGDAEPIKKEHRRFGDIVQGSFVDSYKNLTYKHIMGLRWVTKYCSRARYVLKTDDDVMINISGLKYFLVRKLSPWGIRDFVACEVVYEQPTPRVSNFWAITYDEYPEEYLPNYCSGWAIVYSPDIIKRLLELAVKTKFFWIDDLFITGFLGKKLNLSHTSWYDYIYYDHFWILDKKVNASKVPPFLLGPYEVSPELIRIIWKAFPDRWIWDQNAI